MRALAVVFIPSLALARVLAPVSRVAVVLVLVLVARALALPLVLLLTLAPALVYPPPWAWRISDSWRTASLQRRGRGCMSLTTKRLSAWTGVEQRDAGAQPRPPYPYLIGSGHPCAPRRALCAGAYGCPEPFTAPKVRVRSHHLCCARTLSLCSEAGCHSGLLRDFHRLRPG